MTATLAQNLVAEDLASIGGSMPSSAVSLPGWQGLPREVDVLGVITLPSPARISPKGNPIAPCA